MKLILNLVLVTQFDVVRVLCHLTQTTTDFEKHKMFNFIVALTFLCSILEKLQFIPYSLFHCFFSYFFIILFLLLLLFFISPLFSSPFSPSSSSTSRFP